MFARQVDQHPRLRLATAAALAIVVRANLYLVYRKRGQNFLGHDAQSLPRHQATSDIRLVAYHKQLETGVAQAIERFLDALLDFEFREIPWRGGTPVPKNNLVNHPVAIEKDCPLRRHLYSSQCSSYVIWEGRFGPDRYILSMHRRTTAAQRTRHRDETPFLIARHNLTHYNLFQQETPIEPSDPAISKPTVCALGLASFLSRRAWLVRRLIRRG